MCPAGSSLPSAPCFLELCTGDPPPRSPLALPALLSHSPEHRHPSPGCDGGICVIPAVENVSKQGDIPRLPRAQAEAMVLSSSLIDNPTPAPHPL